MRNWICGSAIAILVSVMAASCHKADEEMAQAEIAAAKPARQIEWDDLDKAGRRMTAFDRIERKK